MVSSTTEPGKARLALGQRLRAERKARGLTLKQLSEHSGLALSTLSKMELGQTSVAYEKVAAVARALGLDVGLLFAGPAAPAATGGAAVAWSGGGEGPLYRSVAAAGAGGLGPGRPQPRHSRGGGNPERCKRARSAHWLPGSPGSPPSRG